MRTAESPLTKFQRRIAVRLRGYSLLAQHEGDGKVAADIRAMGQKKLAMLKGTPHPVLTDADAASWALRLAPNGRQFAVQRAQGTKGGLR